MTKPEIGTHRWPTFLADGKRFLYLANAGSANSNGIYLQSAPGGWSWMRGIRNIWLRFLARGSSDLWMTEMVAERDAHHFRPVHQSVSGLDS
jgi:hypothetical protein